LIRVRFGEIRLPESLRANAHEPLKPGQVNLLMGAVGLKEDNFINKKGVKK
jgi:23S rRNA pseudouridine2605 synthase